MNGRPTAGFAGTRRTRPLRPTGDDGPPIYTLEPVPGLPPVGITPFAGTMHRPGGLPRRPHAHDFLALAYFTRGGGSVWLADRQWPVRAGDVFLVAPGDVVGAGDETGGHTGAEGWAVYFAPEVVGSGGPGTFLSWRAHPLLFPFVGGAAGGAQRLSVPAAERPTWSTRISALQRELADRGDGHREAVLAHLTLLLVELSRLAANVVEDLRLRDEPLLAEVFDYIERRYGEPISLRDVAATVGLTPGHLTTVVRRKTGRTVGAWITERRMAQARTLLVQTDLAVEDVGRRVGYGDPAYFARAFRRMHGAPPLGWRRASRP